MASTGQQPSTAPSAGRREMMYCHECHDEWYRDEHGIICPECDSEFTEIIEDGNDPRDNAMHDMGHDSDSDESIPSLEEAPPNSHPLHNHNPWADDDPEDSDISQMRRPGAQEINQIRFEPVGPGRFHVSATIHRTISPAALGQNGNGPNTVGGFTSFLTNILQGARPAGQPQNPAGEGQANAGPRPSQDGQPHVSRFPYTASARLRPRDSNNPEPRLEPVDDLHNVISGLFAAFGEPPGGRPGGPDHNNDFDGMPMNPLLGFFAAMSGGQHGDFVYSQEALDRIISQLMEQTATSNAPGPASQEAIDALPKRKVTEEMLGAEGRAECSICMDEVNIGEEVTVLPCKHWFHHPCVSAWLNEHDTCPHCRKGITKHDENAGNTAAGGTASSSTSAADPVANMPGAFGVTGEGTPSNPYIVPGTVPPSVATDPNTNTAQSQEGATESSSGGGITERLRRGWSSGPRG
ncbi:hypothetical protein K458DRAFT_367492 [Lentithecium fluviatile CBS 122367]|uniref:RING-type E3 ubiquitin transferase n=1 Tax=Lentithecium fluviatile CBS 122367 TaxID=1168545 RepID=A0A6G1J0M0_9PLEO|nr:hypothetical protein K458DRAFT_367492 [Lentithecium fluviatile CBS 122367]